MNVVHSSLLLALIALASTRIALGGDPDILADFIIPPNNSVVDGNFFTYSGFTAVINQNPENFTITKASMIEFPALNGQSVSYALLQYPPSGLNPPHTHPRAAELLFLISGCLQVGIVDTKNVLYNQTIQAGDIFVFPKGLVHFQYNPDTESPATAISSFGSASAGTVSVPLSVFASGIDDGILAMAFKTDVYTIQKIKAGFPTPKP